MSVYSGQPAGQPVRAALKRISVYFLVTVKTQYTSQLKFVHNAQALKKYYTAISAESHKINRKQFKTAKKSK